MAFESDEHVRSQRVLELVHDSEPVQASVRQYAIGGCTVVEVSGEIDLATSSLLREALLSTSEPPAQWSST